MARCVHCARPIAGGEEACPVCGGEQPVEWMVKLVYCLTFLFIQGAFYRLIWPGADSLLLYGAYFLATTSAATVLLIAWRRFKKRRGPALDGHRHDSLND